MKKRKIAIVVSTFLVVAIGLAGCGKPYNNFDYDKYIKVGDYKGLEVQPYTVEVTDEEIEAEIASRLEAAATTKEVEKGTVKDGDIAIITYEGKVDGKTFEGGSAERSSLTIGSGSFIEGFEDGLIGVEVGKSKTLDLTFPKDYPQNEELAGKAVTFTVTVDAIQQEEVPKLDKDFIKASGSKSKTVDEYKKEVKKDLTEQEEETGKSTQKEYLWNQVLTSSEVKKDKDEKEKYPEKETKKIEERITEQQEEAAEQYDMEFSDYRDQVLGMDEKTFKEQVKLAAQSEVRNQMIVYYIAEKENIEVTDKEYDKFIQDTLAQYGYTEDSFKESYNKSYEEYIGKEAILYQKYLEKVQDLLLKKAKVVDQLTKDEATEETKPAE